MSSLQKTPTLLLFTLPLCFHLLACAAPIASDPAVEPGIEAVAAEKTGEDEAGTRPEAEAAPKVETKTADAVGSCAEGVVQDDGTVETGYGFVPQAVEGTYVQLFHRNQFASDEINKVCACFLKTRHEQELAYEVVFFESVDGKPAASPYATFPGVAKEVPNSVEDAGSFYEVDVSGVTLSDGPVYIGVRWNPNAFKFTFICTDTSTETVTTEVFFRDDQKAQWQSVFTTRDPMFRNHRSILLRASAKPEASQPNP